MSVMKYFVPVVAAAGSAFGASIASSCSNSATTTISNAAGASALSGCSTYSGSIAIATSLGEAVSLSGIQTITGDLVALNNSLIPSLSASSLTTIGGTFKLDTLQILSTLSFPALSMVDSIVWNALAGLQGLSFSSTGVQQANELNIQNTQLQSLSGINLQVVKTVYIANNNYLNDIEMQLGNISTSLTIESNGDNVSAIFPNLMWAANMTFRNVSQISLASLESVNGSLGFYDNEFTTLNCANLTNVGTSSGDLTFVSNTALTNVSMPKLKKIGGGFSIQNNTQYKIIDGFASLATITGAFDLYGNFTNVTFPALNEVDGAFNLQSSSTLDCTSFQSLKSSSKIRGKYVCKGAVASPSGVGSNPTSTSSGSSSTKTGAANAMYVPTAAAGLMGVVAAVFGLL